MTVQSKKVNNVKFRGLVGRTPAKAAAKRSRAATTDALDSVHQLISDLHDVGVVSKQTMRKFDTLCLPPAVEFRPEQIVKIREEAHMSQPVFAVCLGTTKSTVAQWESGAKKPSGPSRRLLEVFAKHGVSIFG
jgi:putative transcriptional regulator